MKRRPLKRTSPKGALIKQCDELLSKILRSKHKVCQICGKATCRPLGVFHIFDKGRYPRLRYHPYNLLVVGWMPCHHTWHQVAPHDERVKIIHNRINAIRPNYEDRLKVLNAVSPKITPAYLCALRATLQRELSVI